MNVTHKGVLDLLQVYRQKVEKPKPSKEEVLQERQRLDQLVSPPDDLAIKHLRVECARRNLYLDGTLEDLIQRLKDDLLTKSISYSSQSQERRRAEK